MATATAQNSTQTAPGRPFPKGVSGNSGGRPKGLVRRIREQTRDGEELVDYMLSVFRDKNGSRRDRIAAATWLSDCGFGKPTQTTATVEAPAEALSPLMARVDELLMARLDELSDDELAAMEEMNPDELAEFVEATGW
jgi:hypothetical protein